jgi:hypothetical protein
MYDVGWDAESWLAQVGALSAQRVGGHGACGERDDWLGLGVRGGAGWDTIWSSAGSAHGLALGDSASQSSARAWC